MIRITSSLWAPATRIFTSSQKRWSVCREASWRRGAGKAGKDGEGAGLYAAIALGGAFFHGFAGNPRTEVDRPRAGRRKRVQRDRKIQHDGYDGGKFLIRHSAAEPIFENRYDAGRKLAEKLMEYNNKAAVVLGIPNGGVAVALGVALAIGADFDLVISRKIPLPLSPEGGFGSVTDDGTIILNEDAVKKARSEERRVGKECRSRW